MSDMDLLIPINAMDSAGQILTLNGYDASPLDEPHDFQIEISYRKKKSPYCLIELHSSIFIAPNTPTPSQLDWYLEHRQAYQKNGHTVWTFSPITQFLQLAGHIWFHHNGSDLLGFYDIYRHSFMYFDQIDWEQVVSIGQEFEMLLPLQQVFPELANVWGVPVPSTTLERLMSMSPSFREVHKFGHIWNDEDQSYLSLLLGHSLSYPDWRSRIHYAWSVLFPTSDYIRRRYNARGPFRLIFFYFYRLYSRAVQQTKRAIGKRQVTKTS